MQAAGIDTTIFKPYSTLAASTSKAKNCKVPVCSILKPASWSTDCVFHRFYNNPIDSQQPDLFCHDILLDVL